MITNEKIDLTGLQEIKEAINRDCAAAAKPGLRKKPCNYIIKLDKGNGRSKVLQYAASRYRECGILDFSSSRDESVELQFDGSYYRFRLGQEIVERAAEYKNYFEGVVGISGVPIKPMTNENRAELMSWLMELTGHAVVFFFLSGEPEEKEYLRFLEEVPCETLYIEPSGYTLKDFAEVMITRLSENGLVFDNVQFAADMFAGLLKNADKITMKETCAFLNILMRFISVDNSILSIDEQALRNEYGFVISNTAKGGEVK